MIERENPTDKTIRKTYFNWEQIHSLQNVIVLNWTARHTAHAHRQPCMVSVLRSRLENGVWSGRPGPLTDLIILTALPSLNQLLLLQNSLIILVNSWNARVLCSEWIHWQVLPEQLINCFELFDNGVVVTGSQEITSTTGRDDLVISKWQVSEPKKSHWHLLRAKPKKHVAFWRLHWPFLLVASFWHIISFYDKRLYIS